jgi:hypothetical protein
VVKGRSGTEQIKKTNTQPVKYDFWKLCWAASFSDPGKIVHSNEIRKTQNEHLIIVCQNLIGPDS